MLLRRMTNTTVSRDAAMDDAMKKEKANAFSFFSALWNSQYVDRRNYRNSVGLTVSVKTACDIFGICNPYGYKEAHRRTE